MKPDLVAGGAGLRRSQRRSRHGRLSFAAWLVLAALMLGACAPAAKEDVLASAGQQRTAALALRALEARTLRDAVGSSPLLLMDDPFAELDARRAARILALLADGGLGQTVLAVPRADDIPPALTRLARFEITDGVLHVPGEPPATLPDWSEAGAQQGEEPADGSASEHEVSDEADIDAEDSEEVDDDHSDGRGRHDATDADDNGDGSGDGSLAAAGGAVEGLRS